MALTLHGHYEDTPHPGNAARRFGGGRGTEFKGFLRRARRPGWTVYRQANGHWRWINPQGQLVLTTPGTPNRAGVHIAIAKLRKAGL